MPPNADQLLTVELAAHPKVQANYLFYRKKMVSTDKEGTFRGVLCAIIQAQQLGQVAGKVHPYLSDCVRYLIIRCRLSEAGMTYWRSQL